MVVVFMVGSHGNDNNGGKENIGMTMMMTIMMTMISY